MKRVHLIAALLAAVLCLALLCACGSKKTEANKTDAPTADTPTSGTPTESETNVPTVTPTEVPTESETPTVTPTETSTVTPTVTPPPHTGPVEPETPRDPIAVTGVKLPASTLSMIVGQLRTLNAIILPSNADNQDVTYESSDPTVVSVEGSTLTAVKEGTATVTVHTVDGDKTASCTVTVKERGLDDPIDLLDMSKSRKINDLSGYDGGLRVKTSQELLFSPTLHELLSVVNSAADYNNYLAYARFTYLPADDSEVEYTYPSITLQPVQSKGDWVDFFLQGENIDCGFCPIAETSYRIELVIVKKNAPNKALLDGVFTMTAEAGFKDSPYYDPTPVEGQLHREPGQFIIRYIANANGKIQGEAKQLVDKDHGSTEVVAVPDEGYLFSSWSDGVTTPARSGDIVESDTRVYAYFIKDIGETAIPTMYITTDSGRPVTTKNYESAIVTIVGANKANQNISSVVVNIKGRGNSSWNGGAAQSNYDSKNSYHLKFDEQIKLIGIGDSKNKDWVLNSNKFDLSGLRNWMVWDLANKMGTLPYVPEGKWVQLYVNNEYRGMYMLCELVEVAADRVNVNDTIPDADKGFLVEADFRGNYETEPYFYISGYMDYPNTTNKLHDAVEFTIKSQTNGPEDVLFIQSYIQRIHDAIKKNDRATIEELMDMPSFVDMYILEEWSKDCDVGRASFYLQKDAGGKVYCTAPWDFDFGFGTYGPANNTWGLVSQGKGGVNPWYNMLIEYKWFRDLVADRMKELQSAFEETMNDVIEKGDELEADADMNAYFWNLYGRNFHGYVSSQVSRDLRSYDQHIDFLTGWAEDRWENLLGEVENYADYY